MANNPNTVKCPNCAAAIDTSTAVGGVVKCRYCKQPIVLPKTTDNAAYVALETANNFLNLCDFDRAYDTYRSIADKFPNEPEAYFGMALATNKVRYIKDVKNNCLQPICYNATNNSFACDANYIKALTLSTAEQKSEYIRRANEIDYIRNEFYKLKQSGKEYDCFICVKVTSENGHKTIDSERANDIYYHLKDKGYRPFYSEREIQNETGADYEARILYALFSSPCMLVVCSDESYLQTPWVKNEYSRFISLINDELKETNSIAIGFFDTPIERLPGRNGRIQGVCLKNPDAYSKILDFINNCSPEAKKREQQAAAARKAEKAELKHMLEEQSRVQRELQEKLAELQNIELAAQQRASISSSDKTSYLNLIKKFLENEEFAQAEKYCDYVLALDGADPEAHMSMLLASFGVRNSSELSRAVRSKKFATSREVEDIQNNSKFVAAKRYAHSYADVLNDIESYLTEQLKRLVESERYVREQEEQARRRNDYEKECRDYILQHSVIKKAGRYDYQYKSGETILTKYNGNRSDLTIPYGSVKGIGDGAFENHEELNSIVVGIAMIGSGAFRGCTNLKRAELSTVSKLTDGIFSDCENLTELIFPHDITRIQSEALAGCKCLTKLEIPRSIEYIGQSIINDSGISEISLDTFKKDVKMSYAFYGCKNLRKIKLGKGITKVAPHMFENCVNLESIDLSHVKEIGENAFSGCTGLKEIIIDTVESIRESAFENCMNLSKVTFGFEIRYIYSNAFKNCVSLSNLDMAHIRDRDGYMRKIGFYKNHYIRCFGPACISANAFENCVSLTEIDLPYKISIYDNAFLNCDGLVNVTIPKELKSRVKKIFGKKRIKNINFNFIKF